MKRVIAILILVFLISGCALVSNYKITARGPVFKINAPADKLQLGEKFTYKVEWLGIYVGNASLSVEGISEVNGRKAYHILAVAKTSPMISKLYKVEDRISTYIDVQKLYPLRFDKKQREGGYRSDEYTDFDQEKGKAFYFSRRNHSKKEYAIPRQAQDPLSCLYYFRLKDIQAGKSIFANVVADEKSYLLEAKVHKKGFVRIKGVGEWEAFMIEPVPWFQGKIERRAKVTMWFSADKKRIPLLMVTKGIPFVGTVTITLQKIEQLDTQNQ